jgi:redox-sensitive bicupin YhaK (pirin superfamily)
MIQLRKSNERGHANHGWLDSYHTFSFADYYDPSHMAFRSLRVINEDRIEGGAGFPKHGHRDMEIITILLEGALAHKDTVGTSSVIQPGEVQRMTAGTGIEHSEYNHLKDKLAHLLQIWIMPEKQGLSPGYEQKDFREKFESSSLVLEGSKSGRDGSVTIHQDVELYRGQAKPGQDIEFHLRSGRSAWVQMISGSLKLNQQVLKAGDGAAVKDEASLKFTADAKAEFLLFDLA